MCDIVNILIALVYVYVCGTCVIIIINYIAPKGTKLRGATNQNS